MKKELYYCDKCKKELDEDTGFSLQIIQALSEKKMAIRIEELEENAVIEKHLCFNCFGMFFDKKPVVYDGGEPQEQNN